MPDIIGIIKSLPAYVKAALIAGVVLTIFWVIYSLSQHYIVRTTDQYVDSLVKSDEVRLKDIPTIAGFLTTHVDTSLLFKRKMTTVSNQYMIIARQRAVTLNMAQQYYDTYYTIAISLTAATILTAIVVFLIANAGWSNADYKLKTTLFALFFISSLLGVSITTMNLKENFESNFAQDVSLLKLENKIYSFVNCCDTLPRGSLTLKFTRFIADVNSDLNDNYKFAVGMKMSSSMYQDLYKDLSQKTGAQK
jgi:hypothetical protein